MERYFHYAGPRGLVGTFLVHTSASVSVFVSFSPNTRCRQIANIEERRWRVNFRTSVPITVNLDDKYKDYVVRQAIVAEYLSEFYRHVDQKPGQVLHTVFHWNHCVKGSLYLQLLQYTMPLCSREDVLRYIPEAT